MSVAEHRSGSAQPALGKVMFALPPDPDHEFTRETLWAQPLGANRYVLKNIPFFVHGVSLDDIVETRYRSGRPHFVRVVEHSGHSTYRVFFTGESKAEGLTTQIRNRLETMGCSSEDGGDLWFALDVPPETNIFAVYSVLEEGEEAGIWTFEEGHCGHSVDPGGST